jgi:hypothetical protein
MYLIQLRRPFENYHSERWLLIHAALNFSQMPFRRLSPVLLAATPIGPENDPAGEAVCPFG